MKYHLPSRLTLIAATLPLLFSGSSLAAGYRLYEQSTSGMGNAYAGRGAQIEDATLVQSNPAAIVHLQGPQLSVGAAVIDVTTDYSNAEAYSAAGAAVEGRSSGDLNLTEAVPYLFYTAPVNQRMSWGVGLFVPFGLGSDYDSDWVGRYLADETEVQVLSLQPTLAYQLTEQLSIGAGVGINRIEGKLSKYKDHSGMCEMEDGLNAAYGMPVYNPDYCDSHYQVEGDDWGIGYTLGLHWQPSRNTRLALVYFSEVDYQLQGDSEIINTPITGANIGDTPYMLNVGDHLPAVDLTTGLLAVDSYKSEASALELTTPASVSLTLDQQLSSPISLQASLIWTGWSSLETITVRSLEPGSISASTQLPQNLAVEGYIGYIPEYWRNTLSGALGLTYQYNNQWRWKLGYAFDESPVSDEHRTARMPDNDRHWLTLGMNWKFSARWSLDAAYGYMWMQDSHIEEYECNGLDQRIYNSSLTADYESKAQVFSLQLNYLFN